MVYGFLCHDSCDAARWMLTSLDDVPELHAVLSDRVFGVDLPPSSGLPALDTKTRLVRPLKTRRTPPRTSREVLGIISLDSYGDVLTTLDFTGAVAAADGDAWQQLTRGGFRLSPPDTDPFRERGHGGVEISLGDGYLATVTREFAEAFRKARALAYHLGDPEVLPAHVLYGILTDRGNDAARWLQPEGAVAVLATDVFRSPLPPSHRLPAAPRPLRPKAPPPSPWLLPLLIPALLLGMLLLKVGTLLAKTWRALLGLVVISPFLAILLVTMSLADINTAEPNSAQLAAEQSALTGTISSRATHTGRNGSQPRWSGPCPTCTHRRSSRAGKRPAVCAQEMGPPRSFSSRYLFVFPRRRTLPPPRLAGSPTAARVLPRHGHLPGADLAAAVPRNRPAAGERGARRLLLGHGKLSTNGTPGDLAGQQALVYQGTRRETVGLADLEIYAQNPDGTDVLQVKDQAQPIRRAARWCSITAVA